MSVLDIYAGPRAAAIIAERGVNSDDFDFMLGASGGPKWFVLAGLDKVIFPHFFANRTRPLHALGSSAGAFRFACFGQSDPASATERLATEYANTVYSDKPDASEISAKGRDLLDVVLGDHGVRDIVTNPTIKAHFVVARSRGVNASERRLPQLTSLLGAATANAIRRRNLRHFFERFIFSADVEGLSITDPYRLPTQSVALSEANLKAALMASGSIPLVLEGVANIPGARPGMYRDGGIIDYHFDVQLTSTTAEQGLVLYPHFWSRPAPGWFDKNGRRRPHASSYDNVVMVVPSDDFVQSLPFKKIPDRKDFETLPPAERIPYWEAVIERSNELGDAFMNWTQSPHPAASLKPIEFTRG